MGIELNLGSLAVYYNHFKIHFEARVNRGISNDGNRWYNWWWPIYLYCWVLDYGQRICRRQQWKFSHRRWYTKPRPWSYFTLFPRWSESPLQRRQWARCASKRANARNIWNADLYHDWKNLWAPMIIKQNIHFLK